MRVRSVLEVGAAARDRRERLGWSQQALAERAGVTREWVVRFEGGKPSVRIARSEDAGDTFGAPVTLDEGEQAQGRVALALDATQAWILWIREDASGQSLWLSRRTPDLKREYQRLEVAKLQGRGRGTGFPKIALRDGDGYAAWTDIEGGVPRLHGVVISP